MTRAWVKERQQEYYYRRAKSEDYRSRAAYKLIQAVKKYTFIKPGYVVVDLGAAPGGWIQASRKIVGSKGFVLGVDSRHIEPLDFSNVLILEGDVTESHILQEIKEALPNAQIDTEWHSAFNGSAAKLEANRAKYKEPTIDAPK